MAVSYTHLKKIQKGKPLDQIADELEEVPETIRPLYEKIKQEMLYPNLR